MIVLDRAPWTRWRWADASVPEKIMKCRSYTNDISDFLKDPHTLLLEGSLTPMHKSLLVSTLKNFAGILKIAVNTVDLAANKSGCCVLQHYFEHVREGEQKRRLIAEILANDLILSEDSFGSHKEKRSSYHPERRGCATMKFIGLKNVGEKLESRVSRFVDIYLSNATMIVLHGQGGGGWTGGRFSLRKNHEMPFLYK
ncbi:hypothetical protein LWI28_009268 [Acer negundo]|uniref:Uncharacterized protein n=1 Tax=Acer negundo TaxID=4023 RepID=A0AAD5IU28_ACENE|nr:hypothetical protein LWI28_009268 [Acer negundo]